MARAVRENSAVLSDPNMEISKTDLQKAISYLEDSLKLYDALGALPMQAARSRAHMIRQLTAKLKAKLNGRK